MWYNSKVTPSKENKLTLSSRELGLLSNTDVLGYIRAQNAKRDAQAKAEGWEFWTNMAEDIASEFANVYELELSFARGTYTDVYRDWCGIKGRVSEHLTLEQVEAEIAEIAEWAAEEAEKQAGVEALAAATRARQEAALLEAAAEARAAQEVPGLDGT